MGSIDVILAEVQLNVSNLAYDSGHGRISEIDCSIPHGFLQICPGAYQSLSEEAIDALKVIGLDESIPTVGAFPQSQLSGFMIIFRTYGTYGMSN